MMIKKAVLIAVLCAFVATPVLANLGHGAGYYGGTAYWDRITVGGVNYYAGRGGEFTILGPELQLSNSAYSTDASGLGSDPGSFQTFCLEISERVYEPMEIWVSEENAAGTDYGSHAWQGVTGSGDDLDPETAYH